MTLLDKLGLKRHEFVVDDSWHCSHCHGPALFDAGEGVPIPVQFVGYEHKLDCPTLEPA